MEPRVLTEGRAIGAASDRNGQRAGGTDVWSRAGGTDVWSGSSGA